MEALKRIFLESASSGEFLKNAFEHLKANERNFTFESFGKRAGFKNRSYSHLLVSGKRKISLKNCDQVAKGLGISGALAEALRVQVELAARPGNAVLGEKLRRLKKRLGLKKISANEELVPVSPDWPIVFAAIGGAKEITAREIAAKAKLTVEDASKALAEMERFGIVRSGDGGYRPDSADVHISGLARSMVLQLFFQKAARIAQSRVITDLEATDSLFFGSAVSVKKANLKKFTKDLQNLLAEYTADIEDAQGDEIVIIQASLNPLK